MIIIVLQWVARLGVACFVPDAVGFTRLIGLAGGLAIGLWWAFFNRAPRSARWGAIVRMIVLLVAVPRLVHNSTQNGMVSMMFVIYPIPTLSLAFAG